MRALVCGILAAGVALAQAEPDPVFTRANTAYAAGHFQQAIDGYQQLVQSHRWSASLFYNLGNAWYRAGDPGKALLNYERALALEPHHPEAAANLHLVRDQSRALELRPDRFEQYLAFANANQFAIAAAVAFWLTAFAAAAMVFAERRSAGKLAAVLLASAVCIFAAAASYAKETGPDGAGLAIVIKQNIQARVATADTSGSVLALPPGSEVKILSTRGDWSYVFLPNGARGWIPSGAAELVRL